jgi:hypothetical protein
MTAERLQVTNDARLKHGKADATSKIYDPNV